MALKGIDFRKFLSPEKLREVEIHERETKKAAEKPLDQLVLDLRYYIKNSFTFDQNYTKGKLVYDDQVIHVYLPETIKKLTKQLFGNSAFGELKGCRDNARWVQCLRCDTRYEVTRDKFGVEKTITCCKQTFGG